MSSQGFSTNAADNADPASWHIPDASVGRPNGQESHAEQATCWVWELLEPAERRYRLRVLAQWVSWLRATYQIEAGIPDCWYRHPSALHQLSALYAAWRQTYLDGDDVRSMALLDWHDSLWRIADRIGRHSSTSCLDGEHTDRPIPPASTYGDGDLVAFLTGPWGTRPLPAPDAVWASSSAECRPQNAGAPVGDSL